MASNKKVHPATGTMPKAGKGKCGPGMGTMPKGVNNTVMSPTKHAGGKPHPSLGPVPRVKNPPVNTYATPGGQRTKVQRGTW